MNQWLIKGLYAAGGVVVGFLYGVAVEKITRVAEKQLKENLEKVHDDVPPPSIPEAADAAPKTK